MESRVSRAAVAAIAAFSAITWSRHACADVTSAPPLGAVSDVIVVHIDSPSPVDLQEKTGSRWNTVCTSPCDKPLSTSRTYRVNGAGVRASTSFHIAPGTRQTLEVEPGSSGGHTGAVIVTVLGGVALLPVAGVSGFVIGASIFGLILICPISESVDKGSFGTCMGDVASFFTPAYAQPGVWIPGVIGGALLIGGIAWLASAPSTTVNQRTAGSAVVAPLPSSRVPTWRDASVIRMPAVHSVPFVNLKF
ncbi:MAG: hypothetical protein ACREJ3_03700 [Polyangiaceae bacterium]